MNAIYGMKFDAEFPIFTTGKKGQYLGTAKVSGIITIDSTYDTNQKHWIYFEVTKSDNDRFVVGKQYKKQGKNFYPAVCDYSYPDNYDQLAEIKDIYKVSAGVK